MARSSPRRSAASPAPDVGAAAGPGAFPILPRVWHGVEYRRLDDLEVARELFEFAAAVWPPHPTPGLALGAWVDGHRLAGAVVTEQAGAAALLYGPVVIESRLGNREDSRPPGPTEIESDPLEVATQLVTAAVDHATASGLETVFARPQGLDRVWVRFGFIPVPEVALPEALRGRRGAGLFAYRGGSALWSLRADPARGEATRESAGPRLTIGDPPLGEPAESSSPLAPGPAPIARRRRAARRAS